MPGHHMEQKGPCYPLPGEEQRRFYSEERTKHVGNFQAKADVPGAIFWPEVVSVWGTRVCIEAHSTAVSITQEDQRAWG